MESPPLKGPSLGPIVGALAESCGEPLLEWQQYVLNQGLQIGPDGKFIRKTNLVTVARQNGKTALMKWLLLASLYAMNTRRIGIMAQDSKQTLSTLDDMAEVIRRTPWMTARLKRDSRSHGFERLEIWCEHYPDHCPPGCNQVRRLDVLSNTKKSSRGKSLDLLYIDELRELTDEVWAAAEPTTRARPNAQFWGTSNAGDESSTVLNALRASALATTDPRFGYWEWSKSPDLKVTDRKGWAQANPSLGHLISTDDIETSRLRHPVDKFRTETLCEWVVALDSPWDMEAFDQGETKDLQPQEGIPTYFGLDLHFHKTAAYLVAVQKDGDNLNTFLYVWERDQAIDGMALAIEIAQLYRRYSGRQVAYDPRTAEYIAQHLRKGGIKSQGVAFMGIDFSTLCDVTMTAIGAHKIKHQGQPQLRSHLLACTRRAAGDGGWRIARKDATGQIHAAVAFVLAVGHAEQPQQIVTVAVG